MVTKRQDATATSSSTPATFSIDTESFVSQATVGSFLPCCCPRSAFLLSFFICDWIWAAATSSSTVTKRQDATATSSFTPATFSIDAKSFVSQATVGSFLPCCCPRFAFLLSFFICDWNWPAATSSSTVTKRQHVTATSCSTVAKYSTDANAAATSSSTPAKFSTDASSSMSEASVGSFLPCSCPRSAFFLCFFRCVWMLAAATSSPVVISFPSDASSFWLETSVDSFLACCFPSSGFLLCHSWDDGSGNPSSPPCLQTIHSVVPASRAGHKSKRKNRGLCCSQTSQTPWSIFVHSKKTSTNIADAEQINTNRVKVEKTVEIALASAETLLLAAVRHTLSPASELAPH